MKPSHPGLTQPKANVPVSEVRRLQVEKLLEKGNVKEAFKEAKLFFHKEASPENRHLVERTYLSRIRSLISGGMQSAGKEVAQSMLEFGVKDPVLMQELILILPQVGMTDKALSLQGHLPSPQIQSELLLKLADRAVLHPENAPASMPDLCEAAGRVRSSLEALEAGTEAKALELLQPISRNSPLADWRYFVRGLAAFRRNDQEQAKANWDRLEPDRAARKIATALQLPTAMDPSGNHGDHLRNLETIAFGEPVLERLAQLRQALDSTDWKRALTLIGPVRQSLKKIDIRLSQKLTSIVLDLFSSELRNEGDNNDDRLLKALKSSLDPLPWDPHWYRFEAFFWDKWEGSQGKGIHLWRKYLEDLDCGVPVPLGQFHQVKALIWRRIGEIYATSVNESEYVPNPDDFGLGRLTPEKATLLLREQAIAAFQQSLKWDPSQRETYQKLIENFKAWGKEESLVATLKELLKAFPDDVEALGRLAKVHLENNESEFALGYIERLRVLRPLDTEWISEEIYSRFGFARELALKKRWDEGRAQFARIEISENNNQDTFSFWGKQAAFEFKAGNPAKAEELLERARTVLTEPTALWLLMSIEVVRYKLPKPLSQRFNQDFLAAVAAPVTSETAGDLAEVMGTYLLRKVSYIGRPGHLKEIVGYIRRTKRLKYEEPHLRKVCALVISMDNEKTLAKTVVKQGLKQFPKSPFFLHMEAGISITEEMEYSDMERSHKYLEKALALANASQDPQDTQLIPLIKVALVRLKDAMESMRESFPFFSKPTGRSRYPFLDDLYRRMMEAIDDEDFDFVDDKPIPRRPRRPPNPKPR